MAKPNRSENINVRTTSAEKALTEENAQTAGMPVSEYLRRLGMDTSLAARMRKPVAQVSPASEFEAGPDFQVRVNRKARFMSRRHAESEVRREEAAERVQSSLNP